MTPKLTTTTAAFVRVLSAVGALSVSIALPSIRASTDLLTGDSGMPSSVEGGLAQTLTRIDVQRGADDVRVVISGDGRMAHEVTRLDERRLMIDIPGVVSAIEAGHIGKSPSIETSASRLSCRSSTGGLGSCRFGRLLG